MRATPEVPGESVHAAGLPRRLGGTGTGPEACGRCETVVRVYAVRCAGWARWLAIHTWIAVKPATANAFTVYQIVGRRRRRKGSVLAIRKQAANACRHGRPPELLAERRGDGAEALVARIDKAARRYPYAARYLAWPGPNSNTFTAFVARAVPELGLHLPPTAIGKDYLGTRLIGRPPSGRGLQLSLFGVFGLLASSVEGFELNVLGLTFGVDPSAPALKLPLLGRIRLRRPSRTAAMQPAIALETTPAAIPTDAGFSDAGRQGSSAQAL